MPAVSVIIPTYNRAHTLRRAIDSVLGQTFEDFELLVIDDGSTDGTRELIAEIEDPRLRYVPMAKNIGASAARNAGIGQARGEFIAFQDSDDEWLPQKLEKQMAAMTRHPGAALAFCSLLRVDPSTGRRQMVPESPLPHSREAFLKRLLAKNFIWTQTWLARTSLLQSGYQFNEAIIWGEDWDLALRIARDYEIVHVDEALVTAYITPGSLLSQVARRGEDLKIMLDTHSELLERYPEILAEYCRGIAISCRARRDVRYREGCYWAFKALRLNMKNLRSWLTLALAVGGSAGRMLDERMRPRYD